MHSLDTMPATAIQRQSGSLLRRSRPVLITKQGAPVALHVPLPKSKKRRDLLLATLEDVFEDFEIRLHAKTIAKRLDTSLASGKSALRIG